MRMMQLFRMSLLTFLITLTILPHRPAFQVLRTSTHAAHTAGCHSEGVLSFVMAHSPRVDRVGNQLSCGLCCAIARNGLMCDKYIRMAAHVLPSLEYSPHCDRPLCLSYL